MIIGTVRPEEARVYDDKEGFHQFHADETQETHGSFEVFWHGGGHLIEQDVIEDDDMALDEWRDAEAPGWYWRACFPGCLPEGGPSGPFAKSSQAHKDADEWAPDYD
jgi:hypothetical protein